MNMIVIIERSFQASAREITAFNGLEGIDSICIRRVQTNNNLTSYDCINLAKCMWLVICLHESLSQEVDM